MQRTDVCLGNRSPRIGSFLQILETKEFLEEIHSVLVNIEAERQNFRLEGASVLRHAQEAIPLTRNRVSSEG
jgi:hypothetical protein